MRKYTAEYLTALGMNKEFLWIKEMGKKAITKDAKTPLLNSVFPSDPRKSVDKHQYGKYIWNRWPLNG